MAQVVMFQAILDRRCDQAHHARDDIDVEQKVLILRKNKHEGQSWS
jgi:hypothetical protein